MDRPLLGNVDEDGAVGQGIEHPARFGQFHLPDTGGRLRAKGLDGEAGH